MEQTSDKAPGQRKKWSEKTYTKPARTAWLQAPGGDSTLRRSRSLAAPPRADLFSSLGLPPPRPQLIPRARLVDKSAFKDRRFAPPRARSGIIPIPPSSDVDSLDSNYHNKSSVEALQVSPAGLSLPSYYPPAGTVTDSVSLCSLSLPAYTCDLDYESSISDLEPRYYESDTFNPIFSEPDYHSVSDSCSELNNFDEITVSNNKKSNSYDSEYDKSIYLNVEESNSSKASTLKGEFKDDFIEEISKKLDEKIIEIKIENEEIKPSYQSSPDDHITLITIDDNDPNFTPTPTQEPKRPKFFNAKKTKSPTDIKRQNYLKELLENNTNKKPLKNFLTKNISKAFGDKKSKLISTESYVSTLVDNQFHSLPDINASKHLERCDKIDRKLRKCDKLSGTKSNESVKNRFVVNIGHHFNIPNNNAEIPVDFEVKISKVPKIQKTTKSYSFSGRNTTSVKLNSDNKEESKLYNFATLTKQTKDKLLSGFKKNCEVKTLKIKPLPKITEEKKEDDVKTIRTFSKIVEKPEHKYNSCSELDSLEFGDYKSLPTLNSLEDLKMSDHEKRSSSSSPVQEYQEKLGTMRCFWDKMINKANEKDNKSEPDNSNKKEEDSNLNNDVIQDSPPPKVTISRFESMKENANSTKPCKIIDVQSKVENVRRIFESSNSEEKSPKSPSPGLVEANRKIFEKFDDKIGIFENPYFGYSSISPSYSTESSNQFESLNPNIVEIIENEKDKQRPKQAALIKSKSFETQGPEFDHVRYKVMKSDLFQKNIFANYEKESQFDGLMQYLQDYSFQELLIDNNIVIIEPIRTKVEFSDGPKKAKNITKIMPKPTNIDTNKDAKHSALRRHFFYHPIRVNREVNDSELPNPDTVKQVRQFFESTGIMKKSQSHNEIDHPPKKKTIRYQTVIAPIPDPDRDRCSDASSEKSNHLEENGFESLVSMDNTCCERQYVSQDVLQKIRECGTCITYYGGKVLAENNSKQYLMTKAIMEEIKGTQQRNEECVCRRRETITTNDNKQTENNCKIIEDKITFKQPTNAEQKPNNKEVYQGIKFKLIKSNSCSSRLELVGTENVSEYRKKFLERQKTIIDEQNLKNQMLQNGHHDKIESIQEIKESDKLTQDIEKQENETEKQLQESPKIVAEEKKVNKSWKNEPLSHYIDYKDYDKLRRRAAALPDIEFESYEVVEK